MSSVAWPYVFILVPDADDRVTGVGIIVTPAASFAGIIETVAPVSIVSCVLNEPNAAKTWNNDEPDCAVWATRR